MVKLTLEMLARCKSHQRRLKDEPLEKYVQRLTHFGLMKRGITELTADLHNCRNAAALYLYDNRLLRVQHIDQCRFLTQLYLQRNNIRMMSGFVELRCLEKLHLGGNGISVVEGIHKLPALQELHLDNQDLPPGEKLVFDPRSLLGVAHTLLVLNVAGNRLDDLDDLANLRMLRQLNVSDNFIRSVRQLTWVLRQNEHLRRLAIAGNPASHTKRVREKIIPLCPSLDMLDGEAITPIQRRFLLNWENAKLKRRTKREQPRPPPEQGASQSKFAAVKIPRFPSKLSSRNPHWLPPIPKLRGGKKPGAPPRRSLKSM
mmetsp:Transcript_7360/g.18910  ORF Transcript_7360/g.18910 Transcript_7360/m.18910 type:complete len:315 (-) Transcript_7360:316-1260(-)